MEQVNTTQNFLFLSLNSDMVLSGSTPENFANICTNQNWIRSMNFWNSANSLFRWRFQFVVIQKFCYHGNVTLQLLLSINYSVPQVRNCPWQVDYESLVQITSWNSSLHSNPVPVPSWFWDCLFVWCYYCFLSLSWSRTKPALLRNVADRQVTVNFPGQKWAYHWPKSLWKKRCEAILKVQLSKKAGMTTK